MPKTKPAKTKGKLNLSNNALQILEKRYLKKDTNGKVIEKPEDLFNRVANNIALADAKYLLKEEISNLKNKLNQEYFDIVKTKEFKYLLNKNNKAKQNKKNKRGILQANVKP